MEEYYPGSQTKISLKDKLLMFINKESPYVLRTILRFIADMFLLFVKLIKHLWQSLLSVFRGNY